MTAAATGDTVAVDEVFANAKSLGLTVIRTWGFFDSSDSLNPAVLQSRPGRYNESALCGLDYVILQARRHGVRVVFPFVNSWDEFGGMNQYVRWRMEVSPSLAKGLFGKYSTDQQHTVVTGVAGQRYCVALSALAGHDDFYADSLIRQWYRNYVRTLLERKNTKTGVRYKDDSWILGWELANEPRSSDATGLLTGGWLEEMSGFVKSIDANHLLGTGEEGFDIGGGGYQGLASGGQQWLFNGSAGVGFSRNTAISAIDFGSIHLYPEAWGMPNSAGNAWIRDHIAVAGAWGKPLIIGEFGVQFEKAQTYDSWLSTIVLDGAAGGLVWQLLDGTRQDAKSMASIVPVVILCVRYCVCMRGNSKRSPDRGHSLLHLSSSSSRTIQTRSILRQQSRSRFRTTRGLSLISSTLSVSVCTGWLMECGWLARARSCLMQDRWRAGPIFTHCL
jgi:mannan endo-1,4-beta-mannosidase